MSKKKNRIKRKQVNWERSPPQCRSCLYFQPSKAAGALVGQPFAPPRCTFNDFYTEPNSICDEWRTRTGERLEP